VCSSDLSDLEAFAGRLPALQEAGATTIAVPSSLLDAPGLLEEANTFVKAEGLSGRVFTQLAAEPGPPAWPRLIDRMNAWREAAPEIPAMVTTVGLQAFLPDGLDIWGIHLPMLDTINNKAILERNAEGGTAWWYVHHTPPRPYGNLFLDFAALEHRVLFMQAWASGFAGMHYWSAFHSPHEDDVYSSQLDITPANGNGVLLYPGREGVVPSIRLACVRDGLEDFDYLALLSQTLKEARAANLAPRLIAQAEEALNLEEIIPNLVGFTRDESAFASKRVELGRAIAALRTPLRAK